MSEVIVTRKPTAMAEDWAKSKAGPHEFGSLRMRLSQVVDSEIFLSGRERHVDGKIMGRDHGDAQKSGLRRLLKAAPEAVPDLYPCSSCRGRRG